MNNGAKAVLALLVIGIVLLAMPSNGLPTAGFKAIFGSQPWLGGANGQIGGVPGSQGTIIPVGQVSFKMSLIATYTDTTQETIFEKSSLPGLALIQVHGKQVKHVDALAVVAIATDKPLSSQANAHFILNFTAYNEQLNKMKWFYRELDSPLVNNNTLAIATLPALRVLPEEVFEDRVHQCTTPDANGVVVCRSLTPEQTQIGETRRMDWTINAQVTITDPAYPTLSLIRSGSSLAFADFNADGSWGGGCTNCGGPTPTIGGAVTVTDKRDRVETKITDPQPPLPGEGILLSTTVDSNGAIHEIDRYGSEKTGTQRVTRDNFSEGGGFVDAGLKGGKQYSGAQYSLIAFIMPDGSSPFPMLSLTRFDWGPETYLVNNGFIGLVILVGLVLYLLFQKKR